MSEAKEMDSELSEYLQDHSYSIISELEDLESETLKTSDLEEIIEGEEPAEVMSAYEEFYGTNFRELNSLESGYEWDIKELISEFEYKDLEEF